MNLVRNRHIWFSDSPRVNYIVICGIFADFLISILQMFVDIVV